MRLVFSPEQVEEMLRLHASGKSARDIAPIFGCGRSTICEILKSNGSDMNPSRFISAKMLGKKIRLGARHTSQTREAMSKARKGRPGTRFGPHSPETLAKISAATKGKNLRYTPEQKLQIEQMRARLKRLVRRTLLAAGTRKKIPSEAYLGYSKHELLAHLGPKPAHDSEIDHYVPVVEFFRRGIFDASVVNALPNLRWLSSLENKIKGSSLPDDAEGVISACMSLPNRASNRQVLTAKFTKNAQGKTRVLYSAGINT
jgi:hypothetical protein